MLSRHCGAIPIVNVSHELLGIVTLRDVMLPMYPNYGDYIHDTVHSRGFLEMEQSYSEVLGKKAEEIMARNPLTVSRRRPSWKPPRTWVSRISDESPSSIKAGSSAWSASATSIAGFSLREEDVRRYRPDIAHSYVHEMPRQRPEPVGKCKLAHSRCSLKRVGYR